MDPLISVAFSQTPNAGLRGYAFYQQRGRSVVNLQVINSYISRKFGSLGAEHCLSPSECDIGPTLNMRMLTHDWN